VLSSRAREVAAMHTLIDLIPMLAIAGVWFGGKWLLRRMR
jgi:hypothetical protein